MSVNVTPEDPEALIGGMPIQFCDIFEHHVCIDRLAFVASQLFKHCRNITILNEKGILTNIIVESEQSPAELYMIARYVSHRNATSISLRREMWKEESVRSTFVSFHNNPYLGSNTFIDQFLYAKRTLAK